MIFKLLFITLSVLMLENNHHRSLPTLFHQLIIIYFITKNVYWLLLSNFHSVQTHIRFIIFCIIVFIFVNSSSTVITILEVWLYFHSCTTREYFGPPSRFFFVKSMNLNMVVFHFFNFVIIM